MNKNLELKLIEIFCNCDDFCKNFEQEIEARLIPSSTKSFKPKVPCGLALSEMMSIEMSIIYREVNVSSIITQTLWKFT